MIKQPLKNETQQLLIDRGAYLYPSQRKLLQRVVDGTEDEVLTEERLKYYRRVAENEYNKVNQKKIQEKERYNTEAKYLCENFTLKQIERKYNMEKTKMENYRIKWTEIRRPDERTQWKAKLSNSIDASALKLSDLEQLLEEYPNQCINQKWQKK